MSELTSEQLNDLIDEHDTGMLYRDELEEIAAIIAGSPWEKGEYICEIGCYTGMTTTFMGRICDIVNCPARILTIDCFEEYIPEPNNTAGNEEAYRKNLDKYGQKKRCSLLRGRSEEVAGFVSPLVRFLFIDGAHLYRNVRSDILNYVPKVVDGGIVLIDDYWEPYPGVIQATDELMKGPCVVLRKHGSKWQSFVIRHLKKD